MFSNSYLLLVYCCSLHCRMQIEVDVICQCLSSSLYPSDKPELNPAARTWIFHQPTRAQGLSAPLVHCSVWRLVRGSRTARLFETVDCVLWCWRLESILGRDIFLLFFFLTSDLSLLLCLSAHPPPPVAGPSHHHAQLRQGRPLPDLARLPPPPPEP